MANAALLTPTEAAAHIHVCAKTLRSLRQQGLISYVAITARTIRYRVEDLDAYLVTCLRTDSCQPTARRRGKRLSSTPNVISFTASRQERRAARGR